MTEKLDKVRARIAALKAKTQASGCTEAEALAAAEMAARIMAEHGLGDMDVEMGAARATEKTVKATWRTHIAGSVQHVTNTAGVHLTGSGAIEFVGRDPWPEVAAYLYAVMVQAVERETARFKTGEFYKRRRTLKTRREAVADFVAGLTVRLRARLLELFRDTISEAAQEEAHLALALRRSGAVAHTRSPRKVRFSEAAGEGWVAGGNVTLSHGVAGPDGRPLAIGRR
ncbi:MAG: hypothetical protein B7Y70_16050 [Rhizobiales bacterium 35-68-8]|nr:MAG: hypothetical protein B7Y70_16050 [Rhizobiales bacterium 35-68-8]